MQVKIDLYLDSGDNDSIKIKVKMFLCLKDDRLEIRMSEMTSNSLKPSDPFDNSEIKIQNCETCLEASFMVRVVYKATGVDHR